MQTANGGAADVAYQTQRAEKCLNDFYNEFVAQGKHYMQGCLATVTRTIRAVLPEATICAYTTCISCAATTSVIDGPFFSTSQ